MISTTWNVPFPSLIDDEYLRTEGEGNQPPDTPSRLGLCTWSSKLFLILDDILLRLYAPHPQNNVDAMSEAECSVEEIISEVMTLNRRLEQFLESIPTYLRIASEPESRDGWMPSVKIQQQVLHCR